MDVAEFTRVLGHMTADDLHEVAGAIALAHASVADDLSWWEATMEIERTLRGLHRKREAAMAALLAARAVQSAADAAGLVLPDQEVTKVARAAADVARGLAAGPGALEAVRRLLLCWPPAVGVVSVA